MASWGNQTGSQYTQDMDSSGYKLKVTGATPDANTFQAEFKDTNDRGNAVKVKGNIRMEKGDNYCGTIKADNSIPNNPQLSINQDANDPNIVLDLQAII
jgi:hypothetical protein